MIVVSSSCELIAAPGKFVLKSDPYEPDWDVMNFRLTYDGPLMATQRDPVSGQKDARAPHKHDIRRKLHPQLKQLWATHKFLREQRLHPGPRKPDAESRSISDNSYWGDEDDVVLAVPMVDVIASRYEMFGYKFVPLVREDLSLSCSIDLLFLRRDQPGAVITSGDIDNRLKTLFDALRLPKCSNELVSKNPSDELVFQKPSDDENPFFCLLEDDSLITKISVETDFLLDAPQPDPQDIHRVKLVVGVTIRPYIVTNFNMNFA